MEEPSSTNPIPIQFYDWFIKPLLEIPLDNPDKNQLFREFMNKRLTIELDKSLKILKQNLDYLLVQKSKKQLFEYIYSVCPPKDRQTYFNRNMNEIYLYLGH